MIDLPEGLTPADVTGFEEFDPDDVEYIDGCPTRDTVQVVAYSSAWPAEAAALMARIRTAVPESLVPGGA